MKKSLLFTFLSFIIGLSVNATDYFVASNGYDGNNGTSQSSPWQSLDKLNASFASLRPGDRVLLRRGDTFYGSININRSGNSGSPITISAYGSGEKPVITGFTTVDSWNNLGGNIWESSTAVSSQPYTNMVSVNGVNTAMGRYPNSTGPNTGYLTIKSHSGSYSITTNQLSGGPNWTGADVVIRKEKFTLERGTISSQSGGTLNYSDRSGSAATNGFGFFIQNDPRTLDMNGEWYYNPSSKKIRIFNSSYPGDVKVASIKNLISVTRQSYIVIDNLSLIGSNEEAVSSVDYGSNLVVQNCDISMSGTYGVHTKMDHTTVQYCNISNTNYSAILTVEAFGIIKNNNINNVNMLEGMEDQIASSDFMSAGIYTNGANSEITNNKIERSGYAAINMGGGYTVVKNNFVNGFCYIKEDGGGIYSGSQARTHGSVIDGNIVINGIGARAGCLDSMNNDLAGIFLDVYSSGITISNNTVANVVTSGIKLHGATDIIIQGNTTYNNGGSSWARGGLQFLAGNDWRIKNITVKSNIFFAKTPEQVSFFNYPPRDYVNDTKTFGSSDNNYYAKPIDNNSAMEVFPATYNLQGWKSLSGMDGNSEGAPKSVPSVDDLRFEYNASPNAKTISLDGNYIDVRYNSYNGSITLEPYRSAVLMRDGAAQKISIVVTAGDDQTISLPLNNVVLNGKVTSNGISITNNNWTKVSGPSSSYIESPNEASTSISNLTEGVYVFQYKGTASNGSTATANVQVNVIKSAGELRPAVSVGNLVKGINYKYYEGNDYSIVPDFASLTPIKEGTVNNFDLSIANRSDQFAVQFSGYIDIPSDGQYTFYTTSDDGSLLYIDNELVVNNDGLHGAVEKSGSIGLKAGKHLISVGFFEQTGDQILKINYEGPGMGKRSVPESALYRISNDNLLPALNPGNITQGVNYKYYEGNNYSLMPDFSKLTPIKQGVVNNFDLNIANRAEKFAIEFTAYIDIPADGQYTFYTSSDDGSMLYIDNNLVVNNDGTHSEIERSGTIGLKAGKHLISVGFFQQQYDRILNVSYASAGISKRLIPGNSLYTAEVSDLLPAVNTPMLENGLNYKYYEDYSYVRMPDFQVVKPIKTGIANSFDLAVANRSEKFAIDFNGFIDIPVDGQYTFYTTSDDGSMLYIDDRMVVNNDGLHGAIERSGTIGLKAGKHKINVGFFQHQIDKILKVSFAGPGLSKREIPSSILFRDVSNFASGINGLPADAFASTMRPTLDQTNSLQIGIKAYPNPFINSLNVSINGEAGNFELQMIDALGRTLWTRKGSKNAGYYQQSVNTASLQKGIYFLKVIQNEKSSTIKLLK